MIRASSQILLHPPTVHFRIGSHKKRRGYQILTCHYAWFSWKTDKDRQYYFLRYVIRNESTDHLLTECEVSTDKYLSEVFV